MLIALSCSDPVAPDFGRCDTPTTGPWTHLGLEGQWVTALAETPWGLFAGTGDNGVFRCGETGQWERLGLDHAAVGAMLLVPGAPPRLLVGMRPRAEEKTAAAVFATEDRGRTWLPWDGGLAAQFDNRQWAYSLAMDPAILSVSSWGNRLQFSAPLTAARIGRMSMAVLAFGASV